MPPDRLAILLALHGVAVLIVSLVSGLLLHKNIRLAGNPEAWHLAHSGGSGRGVLLLALAGIIQLLALPRWQIYIMASLMLFFVWTSVAAMMLAAATGERGVTWSGSPVSRFVFALYVVGAIAVFPAAGLLVVGLLRAL
jgi:hypothetical protein